MGLCRVSPFFSWPAVFFPWPAMFLSLASCFIVPGLLCTCPWPAVFLSLALCVFSLASCVLSLASFFLVSGQLYSCPWSPVFLSLASCVFVFGQLYSCPWSALFLSPASSLFCPWPTVFFCSYPWPSFVLAGSLAKLGPRWRAGNIHSWNTGLQVILGGGQATGNTQYKTLTKHQGVFNVNCPKNTL